MSVEQFAVNSVIDRLAACSRLSPDITKGDKTPITDGHVDFYSSDQHSKKTLEGRVPVQVKGRVDNAKIKRSRASHSFSVEREVLRFFRDIGGGIYFYVSMRKGGSERDIFFAILLPFKIDRLLTGSKDTQKTFSIKLNRLPVEEAKIEGIVRLAWSGRAQSAVQSRDNHFLEQAEGLTIHSLAGFNESRPTRLSLTETDFVVFAHLPGGIDIAVDIDLEIFPIEYTERQVAVPISCGGVEFTGGVGRRLDQETILVRLSEGLELKLIATDQKFGATLDLKRKGSFRTQAKNLDFVLAAAAGQPLVIGEGTHEAHEGDPNFEAQLRPVREELARLIEMFDAFGIEDDLTTQLEIDDKTYKTLLALHEGLIRDRPVKGNSDGTGRYDVLLGQFKIMLVVMPAEDDGYRRIVDPFDPTRRDRFKIYRRRIDGSSEPFDSGTVYEAMSPEDLASILNLRLGEIVTAYEAMEDRASAASKANLTVLRLLLAADSIEGREHKAYLLRGASELCGWLLAQEPDSLVHRINKWQIQHRVGTLTDADRRDIRAARRTLNKEVDQAGLLEACLLVLVEDKNELDLVISELSQEEVARLKSWPVWTLAAH